MKRSVHKGCKFIFVYVMEDKDNQNKLKIEDTPILKDFEDIFLEEVPRLPPKKDIEFTIDLIHVAVQASKGPYRMNIIELIELK